MATRTGQNWSYQADVTSSELNSLPQGWIGRVRVTSGDQSGIATETILTEFTLSVDAQGTDRMLLCTAHVNTTASHTTGADVYGILRIRSGGLTGTVIGYTAYLFRDSTGPSAETNYHTITVTGTDSAVNGTVTYYVTQELLSGTATLGTAHSTARPGMLLVQDLGPSS